MQVPLGKGYALRSAPERAFGISYAISRGNPEFEDFLEYGSDLQGLNYCFWVVRSDEKIGGIIVRPNHIEGLFLRPPYANAYGVLQAVLPVLRQWSDTTKEVEAVDVLPHERPLYERLGFQYKSGRQVYIRATEQFDVCWEAGLEVGIPEPEDAEAMAGLLHASFVDYPAGQRFATYGVDDWLEHTRKHYVPAERPRVELYRLASTLVTDRRSASATGLCVVGELRSITRPDNPYANISMLAVRPGCRRSGIGRNMVRHALTTLYGHRPTLKLGVAIGNHAAAFYHELGFVPGPPHCTLTIPPLIHMRATEEQEPQQSASGNV